MSYSIQSWINDGLMAFFFLLVGLEVKKSILTGASSSFQKASLPVFAAIGGCLVPAGIFILINANTNTATGWAIPMATDIAFAMSIFVVLLSYKQVALQAQAKFVVLLSSITAGVLGYTYLQKGMKNSIKKG